MARNNSGNVFRYLVVPALTVAAGTAIGYFIFGGMHAPAPTTEAPGIQEAPVPADPTPTVAPPQRATVAPRNSDYTAPNSPRIHIVEDRSASLNDSATRPRNAQARTDDANTTDIPTPDVEASQEGDGASGLTTTSRHSHTASDASDSGTSPTPPPNGSPNDTEGDQTGTTPLAATDTPSGTAASSTGTNASPDTEASQTGTLSSSNASSKGEGKTRYRVQAGSFASADNARDYVSTLHNHGVDATVHPEQQGDKTVYKVQVGAYRNRTDADAAAAGLRQNGVSVTVSPTKH